MDKGVLVSQIGAREHYAVARALHQRGRLAGLVTDWYAPQSGVARGMLKFLGKRRAASARAAECKGVSPAMIRSFPLRSLFWKWHVRRSAKRGLPYQTYAETDSAFARAVAKSNLPPHDVFFGYSYASLETIEAEKQRGVLTIVDQIDPGPLEFRQVAEEMARDPQLAGPPPEFPTAFFERNRREWKMSDVIVVNSEWSRDAIIEDGADPAKIEVLPLAYEGQSEDRSAQEPRAASSPVRVLWLGQVNVRKGIHYLIAAARVLANEPVHFDIVGASGISPNAIASAPKNMTFHGPVSRDSASEWYRKSDVFILPTLSDGFAITQLEAMSHGLPVITTPNCGRVVEEGRTGFIVPAKDTGALAAAVMQFVRNREWLREMSSRCRKTAAKFSIEACGQRLCEIIDRRLEARAFGSR